MNTWRRVLNGLLAALFATLLGYGCATGPIAPPESGWGAGPTPEPLPRLETGMHTAMIKRIATDAAGR